MFEEDFERCFICQTACKGLYCSSECRLQDKGSQSPMPKTVPVHLTAQLPPSLSPLARPAHLAPSPRIPPQMGNDSSSNSSITSSPLQSPATNPTGADSPQKEPFDLPPPAYPHQHQHFSYGSVPVKIPALVPRPAAANPAASGHGTVGSHGAPFHGTSIDTLRFGRKSGVINSVTSPNALLPRCACGKPANHRSRNTSKERSDSDFARLTLGPSVLHPSPKLGPQAHAHGHAHPIEKPRVTSDSSIGARPFTDRKAASGYSTPHDISLGSSSLLSRSRSDPIPPNLQMNHSSIRPGYDQGFISPSRRASAAAAEHSATRGRGQAMGAAQRPRAMTRSGSTEEPRAAPRVEMSEDQGRERERRGRSRSRARPPVDSDMVDTAGGLLHHTVERESAPSRSRHRRDEREREREREHRERQRAAAREDAAVASGAFGSGGDHSNPNSLAPVQPAPITPSWSRHADVKGVAPSPRRSPKAADEERLRAV